MHDLGSTSSCFASSSKYWTQMHWCATCSMALNFPSMARLRHSMTKKLAESSQARWVRPSSMKALLSSYLLSHPKAFRSANHSKLFLKYNNQ